MMVRTPTKFSVLLLSTMAFFWSGCLLDFDQFEGELEGDAGSENQVTDDAGTDTGDDTGPDDAGENQVHVNPGGFGALCEEDEDCDSPGVCREGVCLQGCETNHDCPSNAWCLRFGTEHLCAPRCSDLNSCDRFTHRDDLSCVYAVQTQALGQPKAAIARACLPDSAGDGVFDLIDNCPTTQNAPQTDSTGDGIGDACSDEPRCHADSVDGVLDFDHSPFRSGDFAIPPFVDGPWLAVLGTVDSDGDPESALHLLDRRTGEWTDQGQLRHAGRNRMILPDNRGGFLFSPGARDASGIPIGSWAHLDADGALTFGPQHTYNGPEPPVAMARFSNGEIRRINVDNATGLTFSARVTLLVASLGAQHFSEITYYVTNASGLTTATDPANWQPLYYPDGSIAFAYIEAATRRTVLVDLAHPTTRSGSGVVRTLTIPAEWIDPDDIPTDPLEPMPEGEDLSDFVPFFVPAPGNQLYVFDRNSGRAGRFMGAWSGLTSRTYGSFERLPEYDIDWLDDFDDFKVYLLPRGMGFGIVGRPASEVDSLAVREIYFACHPMAAAIDTSGDGVGDLIDNCPLEENPGQEDLDGDGLGDACDPDIDGDFIANTSDMVTVDTGDVDEDDLPIFEEIDLSRDSTNDGTDNLDSDDADGDGIPNHLDPFPLDSSNNGTPNRWTTDASGNGALDTTLRSLGLDPYNYFSLPASDSLAFLTEDASGQRTLHVSQVSDVADSRAVNLTASVNPHALVHGTDERFLLFLNGPPEQTERFSVYDTADGEVIINQPVYAPLRSVQMIDEETFLVVHQIEDSDQWQVSRVTIDPSFSRTVVFSALPYIWQASLDGDYVFVLAAETDCRECATVYRYHLEDESFVSYPIRPEAVHHLAHQSGAGAVIQESTQEDETFSLGFTSATMGLFTRTMPEDVQQAYDVTFSFQRNSNGSVLVSSNAFALAALSRWDQTSDLWLFNPLTNHWRLLLASPSSIVEVSWAP